MANESEVLEAILRSLKADLCPLILADNKHLGKAIKQV